MKITICLRFIFQVLQQSFYPPGCKLEDGELSSQKLDHGTLTCNKIFPKTRKRGFRKSLSNFPGFETWRVKNLLKITLYYYSQCQNNFRLCIHDCGGYWCMKKKHWLNPLRAGPIFYPPSGGQSDFWALHSKTTSLSSVGPKRFCTKNNLWF